MFPFDKYIHWGSRKEKKKAESTLQVKGTRRTKLNTYICQQHGNRATKVGIP